MARILREAVELREASGAGWSRISLQTAQLRAPERYRQAVDSIALTLAQHPLHRLQRVGETAEPFLYDDSWLHDGLTRRQLSAHGDAIVLEPGVAPALARLSGLLKPALVILWVEDVRRLNRLHFDRPEDDLAAHLFGRERISLAPARAVLKEAFGPRCFYCATPLPRSTTGCSPLLEAFTAGSHPARLRGPATNSERGWISATRRPG